MPNPIKQYTTVYHEIYGKGYVLNVKYRRDDNLLFCAFGKSNYGFITEKQLRRGDSEITLTKQQASRSRQTSDSIEDALRTILGGG